MNTKMLPIGVDDFADFQRMNYYYVDKTGFIKELLTNLGKVNLFTRPRQFGKSLNMSMLKYYLEIGTDSELFDGLAVSKETQLCETYMGQFPVISISLKSAHGDSYEFAKNELCTIIAKEALKFPFLLTSEKLTDNEKKLYSQLVNVDDSLKSTFAMSDSTITSSLNTLSMLLEKHYGLSEYYDTTKEWYDGYRISNAYVYNPWDVVNWCDQLLTNPDKRPKSYWKNSSGNEEVKRFIRRMGNGVTKAQIERLISGDTVQKTVEEQLTYDTMYDSVENMWSLLFMTGYLTPGEMPAGNLVRLKIPNNEVRDIFRDFILELFKEKLAGDSSLVTGFCTALKNGDTAEIEQIFMKAMGKTISIRDTSVRKEFKENFYHGLILGILLFKGNWDVSSNRESGDGFYDIQIEIEEEEIGIIIEVKYAEGGDFAAACTEALKQINKNNYTAELKKDDMRNILKYGIACFKKQCKVVLERESFDFL